jgi:hypothetical protein
MVCTTLDITNDLNNYSKSYIDIGGWDYFIIQIIGSSGSYYTYSSNDGGGITGVREGGLSPKYYATLTNGSDTVTVNSTSILVAGDIVFGAGLVSGNDLIATIIDDTSFQIGSPATSSSTYFQTAVFIKNQIPIQTENLENGVFDTVIASDGNYRCANPANKYLIIEADSGAISDKILLFLSKII